MLKTEQSPNATISEGSFVVMYASRDNCKTIRIEQGKIFNNRFGNFHHNDMIGKSYGSRIYSKNSKGFMFALELTPELWILSCPHKTEILYHADISVILSFFDLKPGMRVLESGTGSGVLSVNIASAIAPIGKLYTFEYHSERKQAAEDNFKMLGLDSVAEIAQRDIVNEGFPDELQDIDCVFLDLPSPWTVVPTLHKNLSHDSQFCSFSPCIEQVQRTCKELRASGFVNILTIECLLRSYEVQRTNQSGELENEKLLFETSTAEKNKKRKLDKESSEKEVSVAIRSQSTMRGHTGYLTFARYYAIK